MKQVHFYCLYALILFLPLLELSLRLLQYQPYRHTPFRISSQPAFCILPDSTLGFSLNPGSFEVIVNQGLRYQVRHGSDSLRISHDYPKTDSLPKLFMMGCSYTYGIGVNDHESSAYLLQQYLPTYQIHNFAVPGYGTVQSFLQLKKALNAGNIPEIVIVNYADFHDERNALTPQFRKTLHIGFERSNPLLSTVMPSSRIPFLRPITSMNQSYEIRWENWESVYKNWWWRERLPSVNFLQDMSDRVDRYTLHPKAHTIYIFSQIQQICQAHNIRLIVAGLTSNLSTQQTLSQLEPMGIECMDISLDLTDCMFNNFPFDSHPNALTHRIFGRRLYQSLSKPKEDQIP